MQYAVVEGGHRVWRVTRVADGAWAGLKIGDDVMLREWSDKLAAARFIDRLIAEAPIAVMRLSWLPTLAT